MLNKFVLIFIAIFIIPNLLVGCAVTNSNLLARVTASPAATSSPDNPTDIPPSPTPTTTPNPPTITYTPVPPSATPTKTLTATPIPSKTPTKTPTVELTATLNSSGSGSAALPGGTVDNSVRIYLISPGTDGPICGDSVVGVKTNFTETNDIAENVEAAVSRLLAIDSEWVGGLYNPLAYSDLWLAEVKFNSGSGNVLVRFRGNYNPTKNPCDNTRVRAQVWSTVKQFRGVVSTDIMLNNTPLGDKLSNENR